MLLAKAIKQQRPLCHGLIRADGKAENLSLLH